jgi:hypothetical protein
MGRKGMEVGIHMNQSFDILRKAECSALSTPPPRTATDDSFKLGDCHGLVLGR